MNDLLAEQIKLQERLNGLRGSGASISEQMKNATEQNTEAQERNKDATQQVQEAMKGQNDGADSLAAALGRSSAATEEANEGGRDWLETLAKGVTGVGLFSTAINGLGSAMDMVSGGFSLLKGGLSGLLGIFGSGVKVVTSFFSGLMDQAAAYYNKAAREMFAANQEIIESFGNLDDTQGKFVKGMAKDLAPAQKALAGANSSLFAAIGNSAAILKEVTALAKDFGDDLVYLQDQIKGSTSELLLMKKGMGLTGEAMTNLGSIAKSSGGSLQDSLQEGMVASAHLSKQFGIDVKVIGKGLNTLASDMSTFGHLSVKEMAAVATYTTALGVEINALKGVMDKFDSFDGAAESAGKLNEAFGMNIDTMKMMNTENPAERIDMLRQSLAETGKSFDELSRHEKKLMEQTTGLDMKSLQNAMSVDVDEMGFDDFGDAAEEAAEKMTPEQAMQNVAESIKKMSHAMQDMANGPLSNFMKGFMYVLNHSPEWRDLMSTIGKWLKEFFNLGKKVGKMFTGFMKTNSGLMDQIKNIFDLERIQKFTGAVGKAFGKFFDLLDKDPKAAIEGLWDDIVSAIKDWSKSTGEGSQGIGDMLYNMLEGGIKLLHGLIPKLMTEMANGLVYLTENLRDFLDSDKEGIRNVTDGIGGALSAAMKDIGKVWSEKLWPAIKDLFGLLWQKAEPYVYKVLWFGIKIVFFKALIGALASMLAGAAVKAIGAIIASFFGKSLAEADKKTGKGSGGPGAGAKMFKALRESLAEIGQINPMDVVKAGAVLAITAVFMGVSMVALAYAIMKTVDVLKGIKMLEFVKSMFMVAIAMGWVIAISDIGQLIDMKAMLKSGLALVAGAVFFGVSVGAFALAISLVIPILDGIKFTSFLSAMAQVGLAVAATLQLTLTGFAYFHAAVATGAILMAGAGLVAGAVFFGVSVAAYAAAIALVVPILASTKFMDAVKMFALVGTAIYATIALTVTGALMFPVIPAMVLAGLGLASGAKLLEVGISQFGYALTEGLKNFEGVDLKRVVTMMGAIVLAIMAIVGLSVVGPAFAAAGWFGLDRIIAKGVKVMVNIARRSFPHLANVIKTIQSIPMDDPKKFQQRMDAIGKLILSVQGLVNLGLEAGKMSMVASVFSDKGPEEMMKSMENFIVNTVNSITTMVQTFVQLAQGFTEEDLKKVGAVAGIIDAVANLAAGMMAPMSDIVKNQSAYAIYKGETASKQIDSLASGIAGILEKLATHLPKIITSLKSSVEGITDPELFKKQADALGSLFAGIANIAETVGKLYYDAKKSGKGYIQDDSAEKVLGRMFGTIKRLFRKDGDFDSMIKNAASIVNNAGFPEATKVDTFVKGMDSIMKTLDGMLSLAQGFKVKQKRLNVMGKIMSEWNTTNTAPHQIARMLVDEAKAIALNMADMNIDLKKIHLKPIMDDIVGVGASGKKTFEIKPKAVNLTVNFSVEMNAEELASQIYKGNKKNKKEGYFVLTEEAKAAELEGGKGTTGR